MRLRALTPGWRAVRVAVLGGASLALATAAHTIGGGALPAPVVLVVTALVLGLVAVPLTMRRCRLRLLLPVLAAEQVAVHLVLSATVVPTGCLPPSGSHHQILAGCASGVGMSQSMAEPMTEPMAAAGHGWIMWLGHAAALVATAWLLARGERWLWRVADRIAKAAEPVRVAFTVGPEPRVAAVSVPVQWRTSAPLGARGPPHRS